MTNRRILALDPGGSCGWAISGPKGAEASGIWQLAPARGESQGMRYIRLRGHLNAMLAAYPDLGLIVYEQAHQRGGSATEYAIGLVTHVQSWCVDHDVEYAKAHSATVKKWATGRGNADKAEMVRLGRMRFRPVTGTDDEIDALWILDWSIELYGDRAAASAG